MDMGKEIRRLRIKRGLTQEALAAALNVTAQSVSKWECGNSLPDVQLLPEIAVYFGVTIDQLFDMSPEQQLERMENQIDSRGMFDEAEERQIEEALRALAEKPEYAGQAELLLAKLYNNQAEQYHLLAVERGKAAVEKTDGDRDALSELANAWGSYIPDWNCRNHHELIEWFTDFARRHPDNRPAIMWLLDNLIDDRRLDEAKRWLEKLAVIDHTFRTPLYRLLIAQAAGEREEVDKLFRELEADGDQDWCLALTLGDLYTQRQEYDKAIAWYRRGQALQPSPKYTDASLSIAHICEIQGDIEGAIASYREQLRLLAEEWGIGGGNMRETVERSIQKLEAKRGQNI